MRYSARASALALRQYDRQIDGVLRLFFACFPYPEPSRQGIAAAGQVAGVGLPDRAVQRVIAGDERAPAVVHRPPREVIAPGLGQGQGREQSEQSQGGYAAKRALPWTFQGLIPLSQRRRK